MQATEPRSSPARPSDDAWERAAFHELHGRSLHGFALLVSLGDAAAADQAAGEAIGAGMEQLDELRHPERAAAWLRMRITSRLRRGVGRRDAGAGSAYSLDALGAGTAVITGLAALSPIERAALVAADVERLDPRDVAVIVARSGDRLDRLLVTARRRYLTRYRAFVPSATMGGAVADQLAEIERRTVG